VQPWPTPIQIPAYLYRVLKNRISTKQGASSPKQWYKTTSCHLAENCYFNIYPDPTHNILISILKCIFYRQLLTVSVNFNGIGLFLNKLFLPRRPVVLIGITMNINFLQMKIFNWHKYGFILNVMLWIRGHSGNNVKGTVELVRAMTSREEVKV
jgi:hypothetical protein